MTNKGKWLILLALVSAAAAVLAYAGWRIWKNRLTEVGEPLPAGRVSQLKISLDQNPASIFIYDPETSYRLKPSFHGLRHDSSSLPHHTNSLGFLGDREVDPDPAVRKIIFLGDSVAYGEYVPEKEIFISLMAKEAGPGFQLLNSGCPGWSTYQEVTNYWNRLNRVPAEAVVVIRCLNDLLQFEWVWRNNQSFQLSAEVRSIGGLFQSRLTALSLQRLRGAFRKDPGLAALARLNNTCLPAYLPAAWKRYLRLNLPLLRKLAEKRRLIMIPTPARAQLQALNQGGARAKILYPQEELRSICRRNSFQFIDPLPAFREKGGGYDIGLFLPGNKGGLHFSAAGHRRLAEYLWPRILRSISPGKP